MKGKKESVKVLNVKSGTVFKLRKSYLVSNSGVPIILCSQDVELQGTIILSPPCFTIFVIAL